MTRMVCPAVATLATWASAGVVAVWDMALTEPTKLGRVVKP